MNFTPNVTSGVYNKVNSRSRFDSWGEIALHATLCLPKLLKQLSRDHEAKTEAAHCYVS